MTDQQKVWVARYEHEYGSDVRVFACKEDAEAWRRDIAEDWWEHEMGEEPIPEDREKAADLYFETMADRPWGDNEFFELDEHVVETCNQLQNCLPPPGQLLD